MTKAKIEPTALLERLEKKYAKKLETQANKRRARHVRQSLANMNGVAASYLADQSSETYDRFGSIDGVVASGHR